MPASPVFRCRTGSTRLRPARSSMQFSAHAGRSRWDRARAWRRSPQVPSLTAGLTDQQDVASFVAGLTLGSGLLFLALAMLRMGWIAQFLSRAVVTGFLFGAAIDVVIGELPKITGTDVTGSNSFQELSSWLGALGETAHCDAWSSGRSPSSSSSGCDASRREYRARSSSWSAGCSPPTCWTSASEGSRSSATCPAACRRSSFRTRR